MAHGSMLHKQLPRAHHLSSELLTASHSSAICAYCRLHRLLASMEHVTGMHSTCMPVHITMHVLTSITAKLSGVIEASCHGLSCNSCTLHAQSMACMGR